MVESFSPFVYWGQKDKNLFVKVELSDVQDPTINLDDEKLDFKACAQGRNGKKNYAFGIFFYHEIDSSKSKYRVTDRYVEFQITKYSNENWPRLTYDAVKPAWLKIDFDHFAFEEEDSSEDESNLVNGHGDMDMDALIKEMELNKNASPYLDIRLIYMVMYNLFQFVGFFIVFIILCYRLWRDGEVSKTRAFELVGDQLTTVQVCAVLEVIHPLIGWVKTGAFMPIIQVGGRNMVLFMIIAAEPRVAEKEVVWYLFMVWSAVELVRYPYYILQTVKKEVGIITWLRYTMWIPLYPLGFFFEGCVMLSALPYFEETQRWAYPLPNKFNIAFHFTTFLKCYMVAFLAGMYLLMTRMGEQRKKKLGSPVSKKKKVQ